MTTFITTTSFQLPRQRNDHFSSFSRLLQKRKAYSQEKTFDLKPQKWDFQQIVKKLQVCCSTATIWYMKCKITKQNSFFKYLSDTIHFSMRFLYYFLFIKCFSKFREKLSFHTLGIYVPYQRNVYRHAHSGNPLGLLFNIIFLHLYTLALVSQCVKVVVCECLFVSVFQLALFYPLIILYCTLLKQEKPIN